MFIGFENIIYVRCGEFDGKDFSIRFDVIVGDNFKRVDIDFLRSKEKKIKFDFQLLFVKLKIYEEKLKESIDFVFSDILSQLSFFIKSNFNVSFSLFVI